MVRARREQKFRQRHPQSEVRHGSTRGSHEVEAAAARSRDYIFSQQDPAGFWCGELEADPMLEADYIFAHTLLGTGDQSTS